MIEFVDQLPPAGHGARGKLKLMLPEVQDALRSRPGQWAKISTAVQTGRSPAPALAQARAVYLRNWWKSDGFEFAARGANIFARYTNEGTTQTRGEAAKEPK